MANEVKSDLSQGILADQEAADALALKSLSEGAGRIAGAFAEGWTLGSIDAWLQKRQADRAASQTSPRT